MKLAVALTMSLTPAPFTRKAVREPLYSHVLRLLGGRLTAEMLWMWMIVQHEVAFFIMGVYQL